MAESNRKQAARKGPRSSARDVLRRARRKDQEGSAAEKKDDPSAKSSAEARSSADAKSPAEKSQPEGPKPSNGRQQGEGQKSTDGEKLEVSSLLETTSEDVKQLLEAADEASKKIREAAHGGADSATESDGGETSSLISRINKEVQQVLESADEAAEKIREEARNEARQMIEEARRRAEGTTSSQMDRVSDMTDQVMSELSAVQEHLQNLQTAFDRATKAMSGDLGTEPNQVWQTQQNGDAESEEESAELRSRLGRRPRRKGAEQPEGVSEGARLLALQQLMAGVEPDVIESRLRDEFGIEDPKPILDWMGLHTAPSPKSKKSKNG
jgi:cell division septum initiation protein DivIVA